MPDFAAALLQSLEFIVIDEAGFNWIAKKKNSYRRGPNATGQRAANAEFPQAPRVGVEISPCAPSD